MIIPAAIKPISVPNLILRQLSGARQANHTGGHIAEADNNGQRHEPVVQIQRGFVAERQKPQRWGTRGQEKPQYQIGDLDEYQGRQVSGQKNALAGGAVQKKEKKDQGRDNEDDDGRKIQQGPHGQGPDFGDPSGRHA